MNSINLLISIMFTLLGLYCYNIIKNYKPFNNIIYIPEKPKII